MIFALLEAPAAPLAFLTARVVMPVQQDSTFGGCLTEVWRMLDGCLAYVWRVFDGCLADV